MCEKNGWRNYIILFRLVNIPTVDAGSSQSRRKMDVRKWDKWMDEGLVWVGLPIFTF
jgi:hypothetical protein